MIQTKSYPIPKTKIQEEIPIETFISAATRLYNKIQRGEIPIEKTTLYHYKRTLKEQIDYLTMVAEAVSTIVKPSINQDPVDFYTQQTAKVIQVDWNATGEDFMEQRFMARRHTRSRHFRPTHIPKLKDIKKMAESFTTYHKQWSYEDITTLFMTFWTYYEKPDRYQGEACSEDTDPKIKNVAKISDYSADIRQAYYEKYSGQHPPHLHNLGERIMDQLANVFYGNLGSGIPQSYDENCHAVLHEEMKEYQEEILPRSKIRHLKQFLQEEEDEFAKIDTMVEDYYFPPEIYENGYNEQAVKEKLNRFFLFDREMPYGDYNWATSATSGVPGKSVRGDNGHIHAYIPDNRGGMDEYHGDQFSYNFPYNELNNIGSLTVVYSAGEGGEYFELVQEYMYNIAKTKIRAEEEKLKRTLTTQEWGAIAKQVLADAIKQFPNALNQYSGDNFDIQTYARELRLSNYKKFTAVHNNHILAYINKHKKNKAYIQEGFLDTT